MQYVGSLSNLLLFPVASNDNDDLLALPAPADELRIIRELKRILRQENRETGVLLHSRKDRDFFQEIIDAERYILLRYFTLSPPEVLLRRLRRHILDAYLFPKPRTKRKKKRQ